MASHERPIKTHPGMLGDQKLAAPKESHRVVQKLRPNTINKDHIHWQSENKGKESY